MTDHVPRPERTATSAQERVANEHRLAREAYASNASRRAQNHRDDAFLTIGAAEAVNGR